ncbi:MAG: NAD(P)-dependent dehydrogenase, short-chain alcohol dehydrogenase family [Klenkia sp.]|nr:NAD(P)-dependent dehydrogenase, short-chain alcohol dehydrogenase family [Klenkia sp.]
MQDLTGLTAVVTGGSSGLGLGMAHGLGRAGARVVLWARSPERNAAAVAELTAAGITASAVSVDSGDPDDVARATAETTEVAGGIDCLFANAGIAVAAPFLEMGLDTWHQVLRTNLDGTFLTCQAVARHMVERGQGGSIVVVSSTIARYGGAGQVAYATSKTGLVGLGRTLAVELARHRIRCNILIPGWTETAMNASLREDQRFVAAVTARTPVRRWATPEEFHDVAAFLADPRLTFHTGNEVVVDGGYTVF